MAFDARRALFAVAALSAAFVLWQRLDLGPEPEVTRFRDDAYYAFAWARSLVAGSGPCVTPGVPTSGVHLGWTLALALGGAGFVEAIPQVAHVLGLVCHGLAAVVLARVAGAVAALVYLGNPFLIAEAQNGQETALACLAVVLLVATLRARWWLFAGAAVLAIFARSDLLGVIGALAVVRSGWRAPALVVPAVALGALFAANLALAGSVWQDSAWPIPWLFGQHHARGLAGFGSELERVWWYLRPCLLGGPFAVVSPVLGGVLAYCVLGGAFRGALRFVPLPLVGLAALLGASDLGVPLVLALLLAWTPPAAGRQPELRALFAGLAALVVLHLVVRHHPRDYYFAPLGVAGAVALGLLLRQRLGLGVLCVLMTCAHQAWSSTRPGERWPHQAEMALAGRHLARLVGPGTPVGCFNSGILTWHHRAVVNLDGVVNRHAFAALRRSGLAEYLDHEGVRWLCDTPAQFAVADPWPHCSGAYFHPDHRPPELALRVRFDLPGIDGGVPGTDAFVLLARAGATLPALPRALDLGPAPDGGREVLWRGAAAATLLAGATGDPGARVVVAHGIDGVVQVLRVPRAGDGEQGLFERGSLEPVLRF